MFSNLFCSHDEEIFKEFDFESQADMLRKMGKQPDSHTSFKRVKVIFFKCNKCKRVRKDTTYYGRW